MAQKRTNGGFPSLANPFGQRRTGLKMLHGADSPVDSHTSYNGILFMESVKFRSSLSQFKAFVASSLWEDLKQEILMWLDDIRNQLENETVVEISRRLQGNAEACRHFLALPDVIIMALEETSGNAD